MHRDSHLPAARTKPTQNPSEEWYISSHSLSLLQGKDGFKPETGKVSVMLGNSEGCARTVRLRTGHAANLDDV